MLPFFIVEYLNKILMGHTALIWWMVVVYDRTLDSIPGISAGVWGPRQLMAGYDFPDRAPGDI